MIGLVIDRRPIGPEMLGPCTLVFELAVKRFPALSFFLAVEQGKLCALINRHIRSSGDFQHAQGVLRFFLRPLIATHGSDAEDIKLLRLQEHQQCLLITRSRPARILINDDFYFLGGGTG